LWLPVFLLNPWHRSAAKGQVTYLSCQLETMPYLRWVIYRYVDTLSLLLGFSLVWFITRHNTTQLAAAVLSTG